MHNKFLPASILATLVLLASCTKDEANPITPVPASGTPLMPLAVGNYWVRMQSLLNPAGEVTYSDVDSLAVTRIDTVSGEPWYLLSNWYYYFGRANGLWWSRKTNEAPSRLYKYPVLVGDAYDLVDQFGKTAHYKVLGQSVPVSVPAGAFSCWQIHIVCPSCDVEDTVFIAPDIGEVRSVAVLPDGSMHLRELLRYRLVE